MQHLLYNNRVISSDPQLREFWPGAVSNSPIAINVTKEPVALRFNAGKLDWSLVPFEALEPMVKVLEFGAKKYSRGNWANGEGLSYNDTLNSMLRHVFAFAQGEDVDPESGISHIGHIQCNAMFLGYMIKHPEKFTRDDRQNLCQTTKT